MEEKQKENLDKTEAIPSTTPITANDLQPEVEIEIIPKLRIIKKINEGGMGIVWHAKLRTEIEQDVAVKLAKSGFSEELKREAEYVEHLNYRTIAKLLGVTRIAGETALIMEYVAGKNFYEIVQMHNSLNRLFPEKFAGFVGWLVCEALNYGHNLPMLDKEGKIRVGLLHNDISLQNLIAEHSGGIKVVDYGTSRALGEKKENVITGKFSYMPPEIILGAEPTCSSDIYSLGATLYHLVFGAPAVSNTKTITDRLALLRHLKDKHESGELEKKVEEYTLKKEIISKEIGEIIFCSMRKDPSKRYRTTNEMKEDIKDRELALDMKSNLTSYLYSKGFGPTQEALGQYLEIIAMINEGKPIELEKMEKARKAMPYLFESGNLVLKKKPDTEFLNISI